VFAPVSNSTSSPVPSPVLSVNHTEQKPNKKPHTPQGDFMKAKLSPNAAEGKNRPGLKDLAKLAEKVAAEKAGNETADFTPNATEVGNKSNKNHGKNGKKGNKQGRNQRRGKKTMNPHVKVEFQEKSAAEVPTSKRQASPVSLSTPVSDPSNYDDKDVSADGFKAVKK
jgi:hypothetical protein